MKKSFCELFRDTQARYAHFIESPKVTAERKVLIYMFALCSAIFFSLKWLRVQIRKEKQGRTEGRNRGCRLYLRWNSFSHLKLLLPLIYSHAKTGWDILELNLYPEEMNSPF